MSRTIDVFQAAKLAKVTPEAIRKRVRNGSLPDRRPPGCRKIILFPDDLVKPSVQHAA